MKKVVIVGANHAGTAATNTILVSTSRKNVTKTPDYGQFQEFFTFTA